MYKILGVMLNKKIYFLTFIATLLAGCTSPTAMLGPVYTFSSSGNVLQTGLSYGSGELVKIYTGKTPLENIKELGEVEKTNIKKQTLESEDFYILVKNKIEKTGHILNLSNQ